MNKTQQKNLQKAKSLLACGLSEDNLRKWDNLFKNGHNNTNSILCNLYREAVKNDHLRRLIIKNEHYIPHMLMDALKLDAIVLKSHGEISLQKKENKYFVVAEFSTELEEHNRLNADFAYNLILPYLEK